jgi:2'-5' RNA ligase
MNTDIDVTTALTLIIPDELHTHINLIRQQFDPAYPKWSPHINFLFPFVSTDNFELIKEKLDTKLAGFGSFKLVFKEVSFFSHKKEVSIHLDPDSDAKLQELYKIITDTLPEIKPKRDEFTPHLTIAKVSKKDADNKFMDMLKEHFKDGIEFDVTEICMIKREESEPFKIHTIISLV